MQNKVTPGRFDIKIWMFLSVTGCLEVKSHLSGIFLTSSLIRCLLEGRFTIYWEPIYDRWISPHLCALGCNPECLCLVLGHECILMYGSEVDRISVAKRRSSNRQDSGATLGGGALSHRCLMNAGKSVCSECWFHVNWKRLQFSLWFTFQVSVLFRSFQLLAPHFPLIWFHDCNSH